MKPCAECTIRVSAAKLASLYENYTSRSGNIYHRDFISNVAKIAAYIYFAAV
jgi:hypothetical protein